MNGPTDPTTLPVTLQRIMPPQHIGVPSRASFAKALRQRGLLARAESIPAIAAGWADTPELWLAGNSIYEAHLRRVAMEQVFATLRRDNEAND